MAINASKLFLLIISILLILTSCIEQNVSTPDGDIEVDDAVDGDDEVEVDDAVDGDDEVEVDDAIDGDDEVEVDNAVDGDDEVEVDNAVDGDDEVEVDDAIDGDDEVEVDDAIDGDDEVEVDDAIDGDDEVEVDDAIDGDDEVEVDNAVDGDDEVEVDDAVDGDGEVEVDDAVDGDDEVEAEDDTDQFEACTVDSDCMGADYCDVDSGLCRRRKSICETCSSDIECGYQFDACLIQENSLTGVCGYFCETSDDCAVGFICQQVADIENKQCVFDSSSSSGDIGDICCSDNDCELDLLCHLQTKQCYQSCVVAGSVCPLEQVCVEDIESDMYGRCVYSCDENTSCEDGEVCVDGICIEGDCTVNEHCPIEYICNMDTNRCVPGCETQEDCYASNECINGICVKRVGCTATRECAIAEVCTIEVPTSEAGNIAVEDRGCCYNPKTSGTEDCPNPGAPIKFCDVCTDTQNQSSPPECGQSILGRNYCASFQDQDENPLGNFCLIRWDCSVIVDGVLDEGTQICPKGYTCIKLYQNNELDGKYCSADCTDPLFE